MPRARGSRRCARRRSGGCGTRRSRRTRKTTRSSRATRASAGPTPSSTPRSSAAPAACSRRRRPRRPGRHLVAEQRRVGRHPVRDREDRRDPRQHQPVLPGARARVRAAPVGLLAADPRARVQGRRLRRARGGRAARRRYGARSPRRRVGRAPGRQARTRASRSGEAELDFDQPINIQYTSGTTGFPKGATLSHHNILNNGFFIGEALGYTPADRVCVPVPFYHCFGMVLGNLAIVTHGACIVIPCGGVRPARRARGGRGRALHVALRRADDVHRRARATRTSRASTSRACAPGSWPARRARSR